MTLQKFAIGQIVEFGRSVPPIVRPNGPCEVVSILLGDEVNSFAYRVKSKSRAFCARRQGNGPRRRLASGPTSGDRPR
jgi:hypothetical protein